MTHACLLASLPLRRSGPQAGWRECAIPRPPERRKAGKRGQIAEELPRVDRFAAIR